MIKLLIVFLIVLSSVSAADITIGESRDGETASIYLPSNYTPQKSWPLIVLLHGYAETPSFINSYFGFSRETTKRGFILVVPPGRKDSSGNRYWNATDGCCDFDHKNHDDVLYIQNLIREVKKNYSVDSSRVYASGHSNGAFMAHRLACELSRDITAIASFAGENFLDTSRCRPELPVSVLQIHALDDETIKYAGDPKGYDQLAPYPGTIATMNFWLRFGQCAPAMVSSNLDLAVLIPGAETKVLTAECREGSKVELWTLPAYSSNFHSPHSPFLTTGFTNEVLDFLISKKRESRTRDEGPSWSGPSR